MDEHQAATEQTAPEVAADGWEDEPILPDDEADGGNATLMSDSEAAEPSGTPDTDADSASGKSEKPPDGQDAEPSGTPEAPPETEPPKPPEPDYKALYEASQEKANADKYRALYNQQLGLTGNEAVARLIARNECGGKDYPLEDAPEAGTPPTPGQSQTDFRVALAEIQSLYPDATEMPASVMKDFADGKPLTAAYAAYRAKADAETIANLRRENEALKKAESNRKAAPVKGVSDAPPEKENPFYKGFQAEW